MDCIVIDCLIHMPASSRKHAPRRPLPPTHAQDPSRQTLPCTHTHALPCLPNPLTPNPTYTLTHVCTHTPTHWHHPTRHSRIHSPFDTATSHTQPHSSTWLPTPMPLALHDSQVRHLPRSPLLLPPLTAPLTTSHS